MATIVMSDFDFDDCAFERKMVEAAGIQFRSFSDARKSISLMRRRHASASAMA